VGDTKTKEHAIPQQVVFVKEGFTLKDFPFKKKQPPKKKGLSEGENSFALGKTRT